jgi:uncharacterized protein YqhQ
MCVTMNNFHEDLKREDDGKASSNKGFGLLFAAIAAAIAAGKYWFGHSYVLEWAFASALLLVISLFFSQLLAPLNRAWTKLGLLLFHVINPLVMLLMYILTIIPIGFILKLKRKDLLRLKYAPDAETYWIERDPAGPSRDSMPLQF